MATTRIIPMHINKGKTIAQCLSDRTEYAINPDKTEAGEYVSAFACDPKTADMEFLLSKRQYRQLTGRTQQSDVIAYLVPPPSPKIGIWGMRRRDFLRKHHDGIYTGMLLSGTLNAHLEEIDRSANEMFDLLVNQYVAREGVTEQLKAENQMEWVRRMNNIRNRVEKVVLQELIYN